MCTANEIAVVLTLTMPLDADSDDDIGNWMLSASGQGQAIGPLIVDVRSNPDCVAKVFFEIG